MVMVVLVLVADIPPTPAVQVVVQELLDKEMPVVLVQALRLYLVEAVVENLLLVLMVLVTHLVVLVVLV